MALYLTCRKWGQARFRWPSRDLCLTPFPQSGANPGSDLCSRVAGLNRPPGGQKILAFGGGSSVHIIAEALFQPVRGPGVRPRHVELCPEPAPERGHRRRLQPVHLALGRPDDLLGPHHRLRRAARPEPDLLRAHRQRRPVEDHGRRHPLRTDLREVRHGQHGVDGHRAVRTRTSSTSAPASRCTPAPARTATACGNRPMPARPGRTSASRRATSFRRSTWTAKNPDIVFAAAEGKLYDNEMDCERGLFKSTDGGKTWTNIFTPVAKDRGVADFVHRPAQLERHHRRGLQALPPRVDLRSTATPATAIYKTTDGGKTWKKLTAGLPAAGTPLGRIGLALFEKNPNIVYARVDEEVNLGYADATACANFRAPAARGAAAGGGGFGGAQANAALQDGLHLRAVQDLQDQPGHRRSWRRSSRRSPARTRRSWSRSSTRSIAGQGLPGQERHRRRQARCGGAQDLRQGRGDAHRRRSTRSTKLMQEAGAAPQTPTEAKGRTQIINRHVLEILYAGALSNLQPDQAERRSSTAPTTRARPGSG